MNTKELKLPFLIEQDEDWIWVADCPVFEWCFTQGYNLDELKDNVQEISYMYFDMIKEWKKLFKADYLINLTYDKNGKITNDFRKSFGETIEKKMIWVREN